MLKNTIKGYGLVTIVLHWTIAITIVGLFFLGLWMVGLDYYSSWYQTGPNIHRSVGVILLGILLFFLIFRLLSLQPSPEPNIKHWEHLSAVVAHWLLYLLIFIVILSGYLISTADGRAVAVFDWFEVPATIVSITDQEDIAGAFHYYLAYALVGLAGFHALAALKHHFIDKDATLKKMLNIHRN